MLICILWDNNKEMEFDIYLNNLVAKNEVSNLVEVW